MGSVYCLLGALLGATLSGPFCSPASLATPEKPSVQMALAAGCEASPLLFSCFYRAVGRPKRQSCRVTTYGTCYEKISSERLNETVIFEGDRREHCAKTGGGPRNSCSICRRAVLDASPLDRSALRAAHRVAFSKPQLV